VPLAVARLLATAAAIATTIATPLGATIAAPLSATVGTALGATATAVLPAGTTTGVLAVLGAAGASTFTCPVAVRCGSVRVVLHGRSLRHARRPEGRLGRRLVGRRTAHRDSFRRDDRLARLRVRLGRRRRDRLGGLASATVRG
jgi:hypothetical protein